MEVAQFTRSETAGVIKMETLDPDTRLLLIAGKPLDEPIANYGPFVLNTKEQLQQAFDDFHSGKNGFEAAPTWRS